MIKLGKFKLLDINKYRNFITEYGLKNSDKDNTIIPEIYLKERYCCQEFLQENKFDFVIYFYESGYYSGDGIAFLKQGKNWYYHDMSHCSCYGAFDEFNWKYKFATLSELRIFAINQDWSYFSRDIINTMYEIAKEQFNDDSVIYKQLNEYGD